MAGSRVPALMLAAIGLCNSALATDVVVGNGQPGSCTEAALNGAVAVVNPVGGSITFNCGGAATIPISSEKVFRYPTNPSLEYTIDGGGNITLDGGGITRLIHHRTGTLNVRNIVFTGGRAQGAQDNASGGALRSDPNPITGNVPLHLNLTNVTFTGNFTNLANVTWTARGSTASGSFNYTAAQANGTALVVWDVLKSDDGTIHELYTDGFGDEPIASHSSWLIGLLGFNAPLA